MIIHNLDFPHLYSLLGSVFGLSLSEKDCTIFIDLPNQSVKDNRGWMDRRRIAAEWFSLLQQNFNVLPFSAVNCCAYENVGINNGDLPNSVILVDRCTKGIPEIRSTEQTLSSVLAGSSVVLSLTEFSATAPLKILAREHKFRGATLPGFSRAMIPALGLDYVQVNERVMQIKTRLDAAEQAHIQLRTGDRTYLAVLDLRYRSGHASGGVLVDPGTVGNLPSGEAYIVPYEGENPSVQSESKGKLPVQFGSEVVVFRFAENRVVEVLSHGDQSDVQRKKLADEPAYGNIAELGIGVLGEWGVEGVGSTLLDEKLGLHIAFGRSDHFGGVTSPASFRVPQNVIHIDWVYVPSVQRLITVDQVTFIYPGDREEVIIRSGRLVV